MATDYGSNTQEGLGAGGMPTSGSATRFKEILNELVHDRAAMFGVFVLSVLALVSLFGGFLAPHDPTSQNLVARLAPPAWLEGGTWSHPLGTDHIGRDILSRLIVGTRATLLVGVSVVLFSGTVGVTLGLLAGYLGGRWDSIIMRAVDTQVAFPGLLLALTILTVVGPSITTVVLVLAINGWMVYARMTRSVVLSIREQPYVEAARIVGAPSRRVMLVHILPNLAAPLFTLTILELARIILAEAALSFLGYGVQPPNSSWGLMVGQGRAYMLTAWWLVTIPGLAITFTVLGINLLASWLRIISDPQESGKRFARSAARKLKRAGA